jgi:CHAD domain-containing protein
MPEAQDPSDRPWTLSVADRDQPAARVTALLLEAHLEQFRRRERAVREGRAPDDLHKYRITLRRTRSLLAAGRKVFPPEELALLSALTQQLALLTSPVRDLDVLLDDLEERVDPVAGSLRDGLEPLRAELEQRRGAARSELDQALDGDFSVVLVRRWQAMASVYRVGGSEPGPDALRPAGEFADRAVRAAFRQLRVHGRAATVSQLDTDWHAVRKRIKRLRYLIEDIEPLYPEHSFDRLLAELADLQDGLGSLQDHIARAQLLESAGLAAGGHAALLAGALIDRLTVQTPAERVAAQQAWEHFDRRKVRRTLRRVLAGDD